MKANLTPRELQILTLVVDGLTYVEIATKLGMTNSAVWHASVSLKGKLGANTPAHAVALSYQYGILKLKEMK